MTDKNKCGAYILFAVYLLLFSWPLVSSTDNGGIGMIAYIFFFWASAIIWLYLFHQCAKRSMLEENEQGGTDE